MEQLHHSHATNPTTSNLPPPPLFSGPVEERGGWLVPAASVETIAWMRVCMCVHMAAPYSSPYTT
eukprot:m.17739 g.17739  ORF g.17739 m.17739 type:complete len:65 (-) comp3531_c1_seq1:36-230(-)